MSERPSLKPAYLISGSDRPKVETAVQRLRARFVPEAVEIVSALEATGADVVTLCNSGSLFGDARLVVVTEVDGRKKEDNRPPTGGWKAADVEAIAAYLAAPAPDTVLALVGLEVKKDAALAKACAKAGDLLLYDVAKRGRGRLGRRALSAGRRQGRDRRVRAADRVRRRGGSPRPRQRDRQDRDLGPGRAGRGRRDRATRRAGRRRAAVRAHGRLGRAPSRVGCSTCRRRSSTVRQAAPRHRAEARRDARRASRRACGS